MSHPPQHQSSVAISHASPADFTSLAAILPQANATNPVQYLMFRRATRSDLMHPSQRWAMIQFQNGQRPHSTAEGPTTFVLKAVPEESGQAVGFAIIRVYGGRQVIENGGMKKRVERITARCLDMDGGVQEETQSTDDVLNHDFCEEWNRRQKRIYERCMGGKDHACRFIRSMFSPSTCATAPNLEGGLRTHRLAAHLLHSSH